MTYYDIQWLNVRHDLNKVSLYLTDDNDLEIGVKLTLVIERIATPCHRKNLDSSWVLCNVIGFIVVKDVKIGVFMLEEL